MMLAAALAGALLLLGPALLKARLGVDEVVTTLLLNFIMLLFVSLMLDGPMKDPTAMGWPQSVALIGRPGTVQAGRADPRPHRPALGHRAGGRAVGADEIHRARLRHPRHRRQRPRRRLCRRAGHPHRRAGRPALGRAGRAGRRHRGGRPHQLRHARHVARLRLHRHRDRHAGRAAPAGRAGRRRLRRRRAGRRRQHEPRRRRADLHRRRDRGGVADLGAGGDLDDAVQGGCDGRKA